MNQIRNWLYIGKYRETLNPHLLLAHQIQAILELAERVEHPGIATLYLDVTDGVPLPVDFLRQGVDFIISHKEQEHKVLVACGAGISRSTSFALAALKEVEKLSLGAAFREIKRHHPEAMPHPALWQSLCAYYDENIPFENLLATDLLDLK